MNTDTITQNGAPGEALRRLGLNRHFEQLLTDPDLDPWRMARVLSAGRDLFLTADARGERFCAPSGKLRHDRQGDYPVTGDWVLTRNNVVERVLPRLNILSRGEAGSRGGREGATTREQPIAANIDTAFIVCGLDRDYNLRRIERYLTLVYNCGISPVVVLTKADLCDAPEAAREEVEAVAFGVPVALTSLPEGRGTGDLVPFLEQGRTVAMLGSSGAGKSTLANLLHGSDIRATAAVSASLGKGRHTTTSRELIPMPQGGMLLDNPGIREIAFAADDGGVQAAFPDIGELAGFCRFADCTHRFEPGCAVLLAVELGELAADRLESYHKMRREMAYAADRAAKSADRVEKERWKGIAKEIKRMKIRR